MNPIESLISFLTYQSCSICNTAQGPLCEQCFMFISSDQESRCYICNKITKQNRVCGNCNSGLRRVWWAGPYSGELKKLIKELKFQRRRMLARQFGIYLSGLLPYLDEQMVVVPVPTAARRIRRRGFDQAVVLAQSFARHRGLPYLEALARTSSADQIGKRRAERIKQMEHSFELAATESQIRGHSFLLVDDVLTTGATLEAAARLLRKHGATHVDAVVIARHLPK